MALPNDSILRPIGLAPLPLTGTPRSCSRFEIELIGWEFYDSVMRGLGFPPRFPDGHVCQFTGPHENGCWFIANVWLSREHSERFFRDEAIPVFQQELTKSDLRPDIEPDTLVVESFVLGSDAMHFRMTGDHDTGGAAVKRFGHSPLLLASGDATLSIDDYDAAVAALALPDVVPPGLIAQMRGRTGGGWFSYDVWQDIETAARATPLIAATARRVPMRRIAINEELIDSGGR